MKQLSLKRKCACSLEPELEDEGQISDDSQMVEVKSSKKKPKVHYTGFGLSTWSSNVGHLPTGIKKPGLAHSRPGRLHTGLELLPRHWSPVTTISVLSPVLRPQKGNRTGPNGQECLQKGKTVGRNLKFKFSCLEVGATSFRGNIILLREILDSSLTYFRISKTLWAWVEHPQIA